MIKKIEQIRFEVPHYRDRKKIIEGMANAGHPVHVETGGGLDSFMDSGKTWFVCIDMDYRPGAREVQVTYTEEEETEECPRCHGMGEVCLSLDDDAYPPGVSAHKGKCPDCNGTGYVQNNVHNNVQNGT